MDVKTKKDPARSLNMSQVQGLVIRSFYDAFDNPQRGVEFFVREIFPALGSDAPYLVAFASHDRRHYRIEYNVVDDETVEFQDMEEWVHVRREWVEVSEAMRSLKAEGLAVGYPEANVRTDAASLADGNALGGVSGDGTGTALPEIETFSTPLTRELVEDAQADGLRYHVGDTVYQRYAHPATCEIRDAGSENRSSFFIMTDQVAFDGAVVEPDGVDYARYLRNNPVVLWEHGLSPQRGTLPIARTLSIRPHAIGGVRGLMAVIEWDSDEFSQMIRDKVRSGFLNQPSIRWIPLEITQEVRGGKPTLIFKRSKLTEFSVVAVGGDEDTTVLQRSLISDLQRQVETLKRTSRSLEDKSNPAAGLAAVASEGDETPGEAKTPAADSAPEEPIEGVDSPPVRTYTDADMKGLARHYARHTVEALREIVDVHVQTLLGLR